MKLKFILAILPLCMMLSCKTEQRVVENKDSVDGKELVYIVNLFNTSLPDTIKAEMDVKIHVYNKTIKAKGDLYYRRDLNKWKLTLRDQIFNTILFHLLVEGDTVYAYSPMEKTMLVRKNDPSASSLIDFEQNPAVLFYLASSRIPLIPDAQVKSLSSDKSDDKIKYLDLENSIHSEVIKFNNKKISNIIIKELFGENQIEIVYSRPSVEKGYEYFKILEAYANKGKSTLFITYNSIKINVPIKDANIFKINLPSDAKIIR